MKVAVTVIVQFVLMVVVVVMAVAVVVLACIVDGGVGYHGYRRIRSTPLEWPWRFVWLQTGQSQHIVFFAPLYAYHETFSPDNGVKNDV